MVESWTRKGGKSGNSWTIHARLVGADVRRRKLHGWKRSRLFMNLKEGRHSCRPGSRLRRQKCRRSLNGKFMAPTCQPRVGGVLLTSALPAACVTCRSTSSRAATISVTRTLLSAPLCGDRTARTRGSALRALVAAPPRWEISGPEGSDPCRRPFEQFRFWSVLWRVVPCLLCVIGGTRNQGGIER
jgi:hypothetical protein